MLRLPNPIRTIQTSSEKSWHDHSSNSSAKFRCFRNWLVAEPNRQMPIVNRERILENYQRIAWSTATQISKESWQNWEDIPTVTIPSNLERIINKKKDPKESQRFFNSMKRIIEKKPRGQMIGLPNPIENVQTSCPRHVAISHNLIEW